MVGTRRALLLATATRYLTLLLQVATTFLVAHHVQPHDFGLTVLGNGVLLVAGALRDLGTTGYLVQNKDLDPHQVRTAFTLSLIVTVSIAAILFLAAGPIAQFYEDPRLVGYLHITAFAYALGPFINPITALLARDMAFRGIAVIGVGSALVGTVATIVLIQSGHGFISVAWGYLARAVAALVLSSAVKRDLWVFNPSLRAWRAVIGYGFHGTAAALIYSLGETVIYLVLAKLMDVRSVGLLQRAYLLTQIPEKAILAGASSVAIPAFARLNRNGEPLAPAYLHAIRLVAPIYLFATAALIVLARPLTLVLLGRQWQDLIALVQIMAAAHLIGLGIVLNASVLIAIGGIRSIAPLALFQMLAVLVGTAAAAPFGLIAVAASAFVTVPLSTFASYYVTRKWVPFSWPDISAAGLGGVIATLTGTTPMALAALLLDRHLHPLALLVVCGFLGGLSWLITLKLLRHPLFGEMIRAYRLAFRKLAPRPQS